LWSPPHRCLGKLNFPRAIAAPSFLTCGDPAGQERPEAEQDAELGRPAACGHIAPDPPQGLPRSPRGTPCAPAPGRSSGRRSGPLSAVLPPSQEGCLRGEPRSGAGSPAGPSPERRAGGRRTPPLRPPAHSAGGKQQARAPSRLPCRRAPNFLHLGGEEGFMQRARYAELSPAGDRNLGARRQRSRGAETAISGRGDSSWARPSPAAAAGRTAALGSGPLPPRARAAEPREPGEPGRPAARLQKERRAALGLSPAFPSRHRCLS
jgi:hypothetical protein